MTPLGPEELLREMNEAGVHRAVIVPPMWRSPPRAPTPIASP
jgi:hypothetical protein